MYRYMSDEVLAAIVLCAVGFYYFFIRRKKDDFDPSIVKGFTLDSTCASPDPQTSFIQRMTSGERNIIIFYGSQTGTAEEFANRLAKESIRYGMKALVADPEDCAVDELAELNKINRSFAIFCVATYGEGDPTDNALEFYEWLQNTSTDLSSVRYTVFGLGNKTYEHYNSFAKYVDKRLEELGAIRIHPIGLGDDDANIEEDFITWKAQLWNSVCQLFQIETSKEDISLRQYGLIIHENLDLALIFKGEYARLGSFINQRPPFDAKNPFLASIIEKKELYKGARSCLHIELDIEGSKLRYESGDHIAIYPENNTNIVEHLADLLETNLDTVISLKNTDTESSKKYPFPCPCSYRTALTYYVDLSSIPRTHILKELSDYATNIEEKNLLKTMSLATEEGKELYSEWVVKNGRSIVHILEDCPSVKIPMDHLLEVLPRLQARYYSISSSPKVNSNIISITAVVIEYETLTGRSVKGVATSWLQSKNPELRPKVPIFMRRSQFKLPNRSLVPILMIGPGTGFAPFRGFLQERQWMKDQGRPLGDAILYFGCRKKAEDFLYEEELQEYLNKGTLTKLYTAFSRDQQDKIYVTHLLRQNKDEVWEIIGPKNGHIYICGDARTMAKDVRNIMLEVIMEKGKKTPQEADLFIKKMETQRRYLVDVWS